MSDLLTYEESNTPWELSPKQQKAKAKLISEGFVPSLAMKDGTLLFTHETKKMFSGHEPQMLKAAVFCDGTITNH